MLKLKKVLETAKQEIRTQVHGASHVDVNEGKYDRDQEGEDARLNGLLSYHGHGEGVAGEPHPPLPLSLVRERVEMVPQAFARGLRGEERHREVMLVRGPNLGSDFGHAEKVRPQVEMQAPVGGLVEAALGERDHHFSLGLLFQVLHRGDARVLGYQRQGQVVRVPLGDGAVDTLELHLGRVVLLQLVDGAGGELELPAVEQFLGALDDGEEERQEEAEVQEDEVEGVQGAHGGQTRLFPP